MKYRNVALPAMGILFCALTGFAQTSSMEGDVKAEDGSKLKGALIKIDRQDIKGHYEVKTDKKGHYFYGGLPLGKYKITLDVDGKDVDYVDGVQTHPGDPAVNNFDMQATAKKRQELNQAAQNGTLSKDQERGMSAEEKAAFDKANKEREKVMAKNKELNEAFNGGKQAMERQAVRCRGDPVYSRRPRWLPTSLSSGPTWAMRKSNWPRPRPARSTMRPSNKATAAYQKTLAIKPDDAGVHNNYALALAQVQEVR